MKLMVTLILLLMAAPATAANSSRNFGGVGIDGAPAEDGRIIVRQLVTGGPAALAGVQVGDIITHIDGKPTAGSDFRKMVEYRLRGRAGTAVTIVVRRQGSTKPDTFHLVRRQLVIPPKQ
jgi:C-terminal processing protease CtpA/Prc